MRDTRFGWRLFGLAMVLLSAVMVPQVCMAANHFVRTGATGNSSGSDWTNACTDFAGSCAPSSLVRGDVYYVAGGKYCPSGCNLNSAASGTSVITVRAATVANHGTDTGWSSSYVGQAVFGALSSGPGGLLFSTPYWVFDGMYRGTNWQDPTGYGFAVNNYAGGQSPINSSAGVWMNASNVTFRYVDVSGSHSTTIDAGDFGVISWANDTYIGYSHFHDFANSGIRFGACNHCVAEYNWMERNCCVGGAAHREGFNLTIGGTTGNNNLTIRYNYVGDLSGTAYLATPSAPISPVVMSNWYIYGNVFYCNSAENNGGACGGGDGVFSFLSDPTNFTWNKVYVYNNTVAALQTGCAMSFGGGAKYNTLVVQNNLFYGCSGGAGTNNGSTFNGLVVDSTSYFNAGSGGSLGPGTNAQITTGNPFVNFNTNVVGANNFQLGADTNSWAAVSDVTLDNGFVETLSKDLNGTTRTSSRGAFQFAGASSIPPAAPSGLTATVQ